MSSPSSDRIGELLRFALTGAAAYLADVAVFNALLLGGGMAPTWSKVLSSGVAIAVAFAGSRWFTWRDRRRRVRQMALWTRQAEVIERRAEP